MSSLAHTKKNGIFEKKQIEKLYTIFQSNSFTLFFQFENSRISINANSINFYVKFTKWEIWIEFQSFLNVEKPLDWFTESYLIGL